MTAREIDELTPRLEGSYANAAGLLSAARNTLLAREAAGRPSLPIRSWLVERIIRSHETMERIEAARKRMRGGTFGRCVACGREIAPARLRREPWLECCVRCLTAKESAS